VDALIGRRLAKVMRLAWHWPGEPDDLSVGPVHLVFDDGRGLFLSGRTDWSLEVVETDPNDDTWLATYDYDYDGGRWVPRDASTESPFVAVIARSLTGLESVRNEVQEVFGLRLDFDGQVLMLTTWEGEIKI
jgi:hypothetical protein